MARRDITARSSLPRACLFHMSWLITLIALLSTTASCGIAHAQTNQQAGGKTATAGSRGRVIDFEDEVVEGMNKRPLDSLSQVSERDRRKRQNHLYRKRAGFKTETRETLRTLRYVP